MGVAATGTVRTNRMENAPLRDMVKMGKDKCGSSVLNAISTFTCKQQIQQVKRYCHHEKLRVNIE